MARGLPTDLVAFIQTRLGSVWALELMLTLMADSSRCWTAAEITRELRANETLIASLLERFQSSGLVARNEDGAWQWHPANPEIGELAGRTAKAHGVTPFAVIQALADAPSRSLHDFANSFRLRKD